MTARGGWLVVVLWCLAVALWGLVPTTARAAIDPNATDPDNAPFVEIIRTEPPGILQWNVPGAGTSDTYNVVACWEYIGGPYGESDLCWVEGVMAAGATLPLGYPENEGPFCEAEVCWTERQSYWASRVGGPLEPNEPELIPMTVSDAVAVNWLVIGVWASVFAIKIVARVVSDKFADVE